MEFEIESLVKKYKDKDLPVIWSELTSEVIHLDKLFSKYRPKHNSSDNGLKEYREYAGDFLFFLNTGVTPVGIGIEGLRILLPVIKNLVEKGQLKKEILDRF